MTKKHLTRRKFLGRVGVAAIASSVMPSLLYSKSKTEWLESGVKSGKTPSKVRKPIRVNLTLGIHPDRTK